MAARAPGREAAPAHIGAPGAANWRGSLFGRARLSGTWLHDSELLLSSRVWEGEAGYHVVTPLETGSGAIVLVDRGWVPLKRKAPSTRPEGQVTGAVTVEGTVRAPGPWSWLAPDNDPVKGDWYYVDVPAMAAAAGLDNVMPYYVAAVPGSLPDTLPVGMPALRGLPDNHLQYALTWYALAVALLVIYLVYRRRVRVPADPAF